MALEVLHGTLTAFCTAVSQTESACWHQDICSGPHLVRWQSQDDAYPLAASSDSVARTGHRERTPHPTRHETLQLSVRHALHRSSFLLLGGSPSAMFRVPQSLCCPTANRSQSGALVDGGRAGNCCAGHAADCLRLSYGQCVAATGRALRGTILQAVRMPGCAAASLHLSQDGPPALMMCGRVGLALTLRRGLLPGQNTCLQRHSMHKVAPSLTARPGS